MISPLTELVFAHYRLQPVFKHISPEQQAEASTFWREQGALNNPIEARRRARQIVFMVRNTTGELVGLSTAALRTTNTQDSLYHFRMFIRSSDRVPYLMRAVCNGTRDLLQDQCRHWQGTLPTPSGMLFVTENRKLMRPGMVRYFQRHGYQYQGRDQRGLDKWLAPFLIQSSITDIVNTERGENNPPVFRHPSHTD